MVHFDGYVFRTAPFAPFGFQTANETGTIQIPMYLRDDVYIWTADSTSVFPETFVIQVCDCPSAFAWVFHAEAFIPVLSADSADVRFVFGGEGLKQAEFHHIVEVAQRA